MNPQAFFQQFNDDECSYSYSLDEKYEFSGEFESPEKFISEVITKSKYQKWEKAIKNKKKMPEKQQIMRKVENIRRHETIKEVLSSFHFPATVEILVKPYQDKQKSLQWFFIHLALIIHNKDLASRKIEFLRHFLKYLQQLKDKLQKNEENEYLMFCLTQYYISAVSCLSGQINSKYCISKAMDILYRMDLTKNNKTKQYRENCEKTYLDLVEKLTQVSK